MTENENTSAPRRRGVVIALVLLAFVTAIVLLIGGMQMAGKDEPQNSSPDTSSDTGGTGGGSAPAPTSVVSENVSGQEAIDALGDNIEAVANRNGKTVEELKELLLRDPSAHVTPQGLIVYLDQNAKTD